MRVLNRCSNLFCFCIALTFWGALWSMAFSLRSDAGETESTLSGFPVNSVSHELSLERKVNLSPNAATALRDEQALSSHVHRMGQPADYRTAVYMRNRLAAAGWDARIVTYVVPIAWPTEQRLEITAPVHRAIDLYEPALPGDPWSADHAAIGKPYSGYSADGEVTGPLVFVNRGVSADYATLARMHVSVRGAIVIARMGGGLRNTFKAMLAARMGAKAVLSFPEPFVDVYDPKLHGKPYPFGPHRPMGGALRNTMLGLLDESGDPTVAGPPLPGAKHKPYSLVRVPPIPFSAITPLVAQQLLRSLDGPKAPASWKTNVASNFSVAGSERAHFVLRSRRFFGPIWDVIATLRGGVAPNESILIGSHRDAWTYGAIDPGSGSVALLQVGDALGKLRRSGWRPYRSIVIGSWDGEELNFFGSDAWARQHDDGLRSTCWAYINTDEVTTGRKFEPYATDDLAGLIRSVSGVALGPNGKTVAEYWRAQDKKRFVEPAGTGSDHEEFAYHEGIPSLGYIYSGVFGTWHSAYDNIASLKVFDPHMQLANAAARITAITAMRLADATIPDVNLSDVELGLQRRLNAFANGQGQEPRRAIVVRRLQPYLTAMEKITPFLNFNATRALEVNDTRTIEVYKNSILALRAAFFSSKGIPSARWTRSLLYNDDDVVSLLPSLENTLDRKGGDAALEQLAGAFAKVQLMVIVRGQCCTAQ